MYNLLAFDIGTGSGRAILGCYSEEHGLERVEEKYRFKNEFVNIEGKLYWDYRHIYKELLNGLRKCKSDGIKIDCIGIDSWGQDYAYLGKNGEILDMPRAYRDPSFTDYSTAARIRSDAANNRDFHNANCFLYIAYIFVYLLTGTAACDDSLVSISHFKEGEAHQLGILPKCFNIGEIIGYTNGEVFEETGYKAVPVACTLAHDTASAAYSITGESSYMWFSSGSYAMAGVVQSEPIEEAGMSKAGFIDTAFTQGRRCIMAGMGAGMYHIQQCMKYWREQGLCISYSDLTEYAINNFTDKIFDFNDVLDTSDNMPESINSAIVDSGFSPANTPYELYEVFCNSLAEYIRKCFEKLERINPRKYSRLYVISGGAQASGVKIRLGKLLGKEIYAGYTEASAIGNILAQLQALCPTDINYGGLFELRRLY